MKELLSIMLKRLLAGIQFGSNLYQKLKASLGLVFISHLKSVSFIMGYNNILHRVYFKSGSDVAMWTEVFLDKQYNAERLGANPKRILDLGANVGFASLYFRLIFPTADIVALEPDPQNLDTLNKNLAGLQVHIMPVAISAINGSRKMFVKLGSGMSSSFYPSTHTREISVKTISMEDLMQKLGWDSIDIIKFDIEGEEWELFSSFPFNKVETLIGEYHEDIIGRPVSDFVGLFNGFNATVSPVYNNRYLVFLSKK